MNSRVIIEYLGRAFPPSAAHARRSRDPGAIRLALYRIERDWYALVQQIEQDPDKKNTVKAEEILRDTVYRALSCSR